MDADTSNKSRILVVENRRSWRDRLKRYLEAEGYTVETAASYGEALGELHHCVFNLVVVDLKLGPGEENLDGMELLDDVSHRQIPAVVVTGRGTVGLAKRAYEDYDVIQFIEKATFERDRFVKTVREALSPPLRAAGLLIESGVIKSTPPEVEGMVRAEMERIDLGELASKTQQIRTHKRNLSELEEQRARYGVITPLHLVSRIEYEQDQIAQKEARLKKLLEKLLDRPIE